MSFRFAVSSLLFACTSAHAAIFTVSNINDSGPGSLRAAIVAANAAPASPHRITFDAGFMQQGQIELFSSLPRIEVPLEIDGVGREPLLYPFDPSNSFPLLQTSSSLVLRGMALTQGRGDGEGGCLSGDGIDNSSSLVLDQMTFTGCLNVVASGNEPARGGAVSWPSGASITITDSTFNGNAAVSLGSGLASGGALYTNGPLQISGSTFTGNLLNAGFVSGGAVSASYATPTTITIHASVFENNRAESDPDASPNGLGGAISIDCETCSADLQRNYFADNRSAYGGALFLRGNSGIVSATLHNNSFIGNQAVDSGGALYALGVKLDVRHATFSNNSAAQGGHAYGSSVTIDEWSNSIMMEVAVGSAPACAIGAVAAVAVGNFLPDGNDCNATLPGGARIAVFQMLGVDRSASPPVLEFASTSAVIDAADDARCLPTDARGTLRPQDGNEDGIAGCDAGAFERPFPDRIFRNGFEN